ncbi:MAG: T9SS type A sorting domain-containing protein, partial [Flavisolibacter sp.]
EVGQTSFKDVVVTVTSTAGPFAVTSPNSNITWPAGGTATVTWSVNGTNGGTVNCASVNIYLSTDSGHTFPIVLASGVQNNGTATVKVPNLPGTSNRIKVESVGNIFFDISNTNFTIGAGTSSCGDPTGLASSSVTQTSATLSWNAVSGATSYAVDYKASSSGTWISAAASTTSTSVNLTGLTASTSYDWRVTTTCSSTQGNPVQSTFTTSSSGGATCPGTYDVATNGTASGAALIPNNTDVYGTISARGDVDYYKFTITTGGTITVSLTNLPADYNLSLLQGNGTTVMQSSTNTGTSNETINTTVSAGTYYVRVYPKNNGAFNASSCYTLRVATGTAARIGPDVYVNSPLLVSPNPAASKATLSFGMAVSGSAMLSVINQTGAVVVTKTIAVNAGDNSKDLDLSTLANGIYFVRLQANGSSQMVKLVVAK